MLTPLLSHVMSGIGWHHQYAKLLIDLENRGAAVGILFVAYICGVEFKICLLAIINWSSICEKLAGTDNVLIQKMAAMAVVWLTAAIRRLFLSHVFRNRFTAEYLIILGLLAALQQQAYTKMQLLSFDATPKYGGKFISSMCNKSTCRLHCPVILIFGSTCCHP